MHIVKLELYSNLQYFEWLMWWKSSLRNLDIIVRSCADSSRNTKNLKQFYLNDSSIYKAMFNK